MKVRFFQVEAIHPQLNEDIPKNGRDALERYEFYKETKRRELIRKPLIISEQCHILRLSPGHDALELALQNAPLVSVYDARPLGSQV